MKVTLKHSEIQEAVRAYVAEKTGLEFAAATCTIEMAPSYESGGYTASIDTKEVKQEVAK